MERLQYTNKFCNKKVFEYNLNFMKKDVNKPASLRDQKISHVESKQESSSKIFINARNPGKFVTQ